MTRICIYPPIQGSGGPAAFQARLKTALADEGVEVTHDPTTRSDALLLSGGTRRLDLIWNAKRRGLPVVQRLAQLNWVQRVRPASWQAPPPESPRAADPWATVQTGPHSAALPHRLPSCNGKCEFQAGHKRVFQPVPEAPVSTGTQSCARIP